MKETITILGVPVDKENFEHFVDYASGWIEYPLTVERAIELIEKHPTKGGNYIVNDQGWETTCREAMMDIVAYELTGMKHPSYRDSPEYQFKYGRKLDEALKKLGIKDE